MQTLFHLEQHQLKKFGFRFFFSFGDRDINPVSELEVSSFLPTPAYQIDRGRFENALAEIALARGVQFREGALVRKIELSDGTTPHNVTYEHEGATRQARSRWLVDASGRAGMLKRQLGLAESNDHNANAVWFAPTGYDDHVPRLRKLFGLGVVSSLCLFGTLAQGAPAVREPARLPPDLSLWTQSPSLLGRLADERGKVSVLVDLDADDVDADR